jgi:hypothetical protein
MKVFEKHGMSHVSASTINGFIDQPALALLKIAGIRGDASPAMWRGTASEHAMNIYSAGREKNVEALIQTAQQEYDKLHKESSATVNEDKLIRERKAIEQYVTNGVEYLAEFMGDAVSPPLLQGKLKFEHEELSVPILGYYDMLFQNPHQVVDIKTSASRPRQPTLAHSRQLSIYWAGTGAEPWVWYVAKTGVSAFTIDRPQIYFNQFLTAAKNLERILSYSEDIFECCQLVYPNIDHWMWDDVARAAAKDIWKMEE